MAARNPRGPGRYGQSGVPAPSTSFDGPDRLSTNTLKRHPKMELNKNDLLRLLSYLEGELQAREVVIATLKAEKARHMLYQAKYGRFGLGDPFYSLQRDSEGTRENGFDENAVRNMYDNQLNQLENLISIQKKAQIKMREQMKNTEHKYQKLTSELESEKKKHAQDMAQGDDVTYALGKERERLKNEIEFERNNLKKLEKDLKKSQTAFDEEKNAASKHKDVALMLIKERKRMSERLLVEKRKTKILEQLLGEERQKMKNMAEGLVEESKKSLKMEAAMEKQLSDFDTEREQLKSRLTKDDERTFLATEVERLNLLVQSLQKQVSEKRSDGPNSIEIKSSVTNKPVANSMGPERSLSPSPPPGVQALQAVPKQVKVYKTTPPNTPPEVRRVPVDSGPVEAVKPDSNVKRAMYQLQTKPDKPEKPEKPENLKIDRAHEVVLAPGARVNVSTAQGSGTTVFKTPGGGKISFTVGGGGPKKVSPAGRGTPPPVPPNKPVFHPAVAPKKESIVARYGPSTAGSHNLTPIDIKNATSGQRYGVRVNTKDNSLTLSSPESPNESPKTFSLSPSPSPTPNDGTVRKVSQYTSSSDSMHDASESDDASEVLSPDDLKQLILNITSGPCRPSSIETPTPLTPLEAHHSPLHHFAAFGHAHQLHQLLLEQDCHVNTPLKDGTTAVHQAAEGGHIDCLKLLLEFGGNINTRRDDKFTPLHAAATEGHDECLRLLLEHGAHVNETDQSGRTPLYWSARQGHEDCCQILLEYGARLDIVNFAGWSPIHAAINGGHVPCLDLLLGYIIHTTQSATPSQNCPNQLDVLLHDVFSSSDKDGMTVAHLAAMRETQECLEAVLHYYQVDLKKKDKYGRNAYDIASVTCKEYLDGIDLTQEKLCLVCITLENIHPKHPCIQELYTVGTLSVTPDTSWTELDEKLSDIIINHLTDVASGVQGAMCRSEPKTPDSPTVPPTPMFGVNMFGLSLDSVKHFSIGQYSWSPGTPSETQPYQIIVSCDARCINVSLFGIDDCCQDSLAYEMLIPTCILQNYLRLVEQYKSVVFYGPSGTGKSYMALRIAECIKAKEELRGNKSSVHTLSMDLTMTRSDFTRYLISEDIFQHESVQESSGAAPILILDDLNKIAISEVMIDLLTLIDNRGSKCTFCLKAGGHASEGYYYLPQNCYIIGTMDRTRSTGLDLSIQQRFRWVHCRLDSEPVNNLLPRHLCRQVLHCHGGCLPSADNPVCKAVEWVVLVWHKLNDALAKLDLPEVAFGPSIFLSCPVEVNKPKTILRWLCHLWNTDIAPAVSEAVMKGSDSDDFSQGKVANTALYVILQRAIVPGCPLTRQEKDRYLAGFHGINELEVDVRPSKGKLFSSQSAPNSPVKKSSPVADGRLCKTWTRTKSVDRTFVLRVPEKDVLDEMSLMWDRSPNPAKPKHEGKNTQGNSQDSQNSNSKSDAVSEKNNASVNSEKSNTLALPVSEQEVRVQDSGSSLADSKDGSTSEKCISSSSKMNKDGSSEAASAEPNNRNEQQSLEIEPNNDVRIEINSDDDINANPWQLQAAPEKFETDTSKLPVFCDRNRTPVFGARKSPVSHSKDDSKIPKVLVTDMSRTNRANSLRDSMRSPPPDTTPTKRVKRHSSVQVKAKARPPVPKRTSSVRKSSHNS